MAVKVLGILAEERTSTELPVESGMNPSMKRVNWDGTSIELEIDDDDAAAIYALVYYASGWNTNLRSVEQGGGVRLIQYWKAPEEQLTCYALIAIDDEGDIVLVGAKRKKFEFDFGADGTLLSDDPADLDDEDDDEE